MPAKILVIEDDPALLYDLKLILELENFDVITASGGQQGIELAQQAGIDLIICDVMMPQMNGYSVLQAVHANNPQSAIPFIFMSAKTAAEDIERGVELGATAYITKPFELNEFIVLIYSVLKGDN